VVWAGSRPASGATGAPRHASRRDGRWRGVDVAARGKGLAAVALAHVEEERDETRLGEDVGHRCAKRRGKEGGGTHGQIGTGGDYGAQRIR